MRLLTLASAFTPIPALPGQQLLGVGGGLGEDNLFFCFFFVVIKVRLVCLPTALVPGQLQEQSSPVLEWTLR